MSQMPERARRLFRAVCVALAMLIAVAPSHAQSVGEYQAIRSEIVGAHALLRDQLAGLTDPADLAGLDLPLYAQAHRPIYLPARLRPGRAQISLIDLRLALVQLTFAAGSNDQLTLVRAQTGPAQQVIAIRGGTADLDGLRRWISRQPDNDAILTDDTLRLPLMVMPDARFDLTPGDTLKLSTADGAFIANLGVLVADGAHVTATGVSNSGAPAFRPFVATAGIGQAHVTGSMFDGLGFGDTALFSGFSVINRGLYAPIGQSVLVNTLFRDTGRVTFEGGETALILSNVLSGGGGLNLRGTTEPRVTGNLLLTEQDGAALRLIDGVRGSTVLRNSVLGSGGAGIYVAQASHGATIRDNLVWDSDGGGISVTQSDCAQITQNLTLDNRGKGIELRMSRGSAVRDNQILGSRSAGLFIGDQPSGTVTEVQGNVFVANRFGLSSAAPDRLLLTGNSFTEQFPRFVEGDLSAQSQKIATDLHGTQEIALHAGGVDILNIAPLTCGDGTGG